MILFMMSHSQIMYKTAHIYLLIQTVVHRMIMFHCFSKTNELGKAIKCKVCRAFYEILESLNVVLPAA